MIAILMIAAAVLAYYYAGGPSPSVVLLFRMLQRWFTALVAAIHRVVDRPAPARKAPLLNERAEAHAEHDAYDDDAIERMLALGTLNHPASCLACNPITFSAGGITAERIILDPAPGVSTERLVEAMLDQFIQHIKCV